MSAPQFVLFVLKMLLERKIFASNVFKFSFCLLLLGSKVSLLESDKARLTVVLTVRTKLTDDQLAASLKSICLNRIQIISNFKFISNFGSNLSNSRNWSPISNKSPLSTTSLSESPPLSLDEIENETALNMCGFRLF